MVRATLVSLRCCTTNQGRPLYRFLSHKKCDKNNIANDEQAITEGTLWKMDRQTFRKIVLKSAFQVLNITNVSYDCWKYPKMEIVLIWSWQKRKMYEKFLSSVSLLKHLQVSFFCWSDDTASDYWEASSHPDLIQNYFLLMRMFTFFGIRDKCHKLRFLWQKYDSFATREGEIERKEEWGGGIRGR